ncbi:MAG: hypothetical protein H6719_34180 [Sandaracinaceae bacterium]|nr:hypothetical protein [Sandaracinaceae bacterium]
MRRALSLTTLSLLVVAPALAQSWRSVPDASRFAEPGAPEVTFDVRAGGRSACGGGGCTAGVEIRNVRGALPSRDLAYYYSDRDGANPGCPDPRSEALFHDWTQVAIAPARGQESDRPSCGFAIQTGSTMRYWVILRVRTGPPR